MTPLSASQPFSLPLSSDSITKHWQPGEFAGAYPGGCNHVACPEWQARRLRALVGRVLVGQTGLRGCWGWAALEGFSGSGWAGLALPVFALLLPAFDQVACG
eukprot:365077-Chlamydomonas_euryale.AAC.17